MQPDNGGGDDQPPPLEVGNPDDERLSGGDLTLIIVAAVLLAYLLLACGITYCRERRPGVPVSHTNACTSFFDWILCVPASARKKTLDFSEVRHTESFVDASTRSMSYGSYHSQPKEIGLDDIKPRGVSDA